MFDVQSAFDAVLGVLIGAVGWFLAVLHGDLRRLERSLPETYARRDDMTEKFNEVLAALNRIDTKLDNKADK